MALDGFYEWKEDESNVMNHSNKKKQPYYVFRSDGLPLLVAGIYENHKTEVSTCEKGNDDSYKTFTLLTMSSCSDLCWLHHRQPVLFWDLELAHQWIKQPTSSLLENDMIASSKNDSNGRLSWHPVTKKMNQIQYQCADSIQPIRIDTIPSVKSFFTTSNQVKTSSVSQLSMRIEKKVPTYRTKPLPKEKSQRSTFNKVLAQNDLDQQDGKITSAKALFPSHTRISGEETFAKDNYVAKKIDTSPSNSANNKKRERKYSNIINVPSSKKGKITSFFKKKS